MLPVAVKVPVEGSNSSAVLRTSAPSSPPAIRTFPSSSNVAVWLSRAVVMLPVDTNLATSIEFELPVMEVVTVSVALMVWLPTVFSVAEKLPVPFVSIESGGKTAWLSVLVK